MRLLTPIAVLKAQIPWRCETTLSSNSADGTLVAPGVLLVRIGVDARDDGVSAGSFAAAAAGRFDVSGVWRRRVDGWSPGAVDVAFEDFFGRDIGAGAEERAVVEDHCQVFGDL